MICRLIFVFLCGSAFVADAREPSVSPTPAESPASPLATFIPWLLQEKEQLTQIPLSDVIFHATGKRVNAIDPKNETDQRVLKTNRRRAG